MRCTHAALGGAAVAVVLVCGCTSERGRPSDSQSTADSVPAQSTEPAPNGWTATAGRIGPIEIGMTRRDAESALGAPLVGPADAATCLYVRPSRGPDGVLVMLVDGRVARVDVRQAGISTDAGIQVGDREARVREAYGERLTSSPHKYTSGHYLAVAPDAIHQLVFETDGERVTRYRLGRLPEVEWVEGCS
jgi:hypothetical protein